MSATSGTFDSQFTTENSSFWAEDEKEMKLKNAFSAETTENRHFRRRKRKQNRNLVGLYLKVILESKSGGYK